MVGRILRVAISVFAALWTVGPLAAQQRIHSNMKDAQQLASQTGRPILAIAGSKT